MKLFSDVLKDEDLCRTAIGTLEFPVARDGEEMWVRVAVSIPKYEEDDDGYARAQEYVKAKTNIQISCLQYSVCCVFCQS